MDSKYVIVEAANVGLRLDKCLALHLPEFSRSRLQELIANGCVSVDVIITDAARKVKLGEIFTIKIPASKPAEIIHTPVPLAIIFEDDHMLVIDKPAGMTVHPAPGHTSDTLVNALLAHCGDSLSGIGGVMRPGIVHRIDKDTSGLLVVAKHDAAHRHLSQQLMERTLKRQYLAVVKGIPMLSSGKIEGNIARSVANRKKMTVVKAGGKVAVTHYRVEELFSEAALIRCTLETGRTHQIRVHLAHIGHPLLGDQVYGRKGKIPFPRQALHACALMLTHPFTNRNMEFLSPVPADIQELLTLLRA